MNKIQCVIHETKAFQEVYWFQDQLDFQLLHISIFGGTWFSFKIRLTLLSLPHSGIINASSSS